MPEVPYLAEVPEVPMKRYLLFAGQQNERYGGWQDFKGHFDTHTKAAMFASIHWPYGWYQIVDSQKLTIETEQR